jgi:hypothetical protein
MHALNLGRQMASVQTDAPAARPADRASSSLRERLKQKTPLYTTIVILIGSALLLFTRLGHYPLWDDEAITAMTARGVWHTGDTSARVDDHNILAYRNGLLIRHFADRYTPPFQFYLIAPFIGLFGESSFVCRLPFAICGMLTVVVMLRWLWRWRPSPLVWWTATVAILSSAEFFLFFRQCRYYGLAAFLSTMVAYLYVNHDGRRRSTVFLSIALFVLLASQYLNYAAAVACLVVDYALWGRRRRAFTPADWAILLLPQLIVGGIVCSIWNPVAHGSAVYNSGHWLTDRICLLWWNWRDMLASDFVVVPLLLMCPLLFLLYRQNTALLRAPLALVVSLTVVTMCVGSAGTSIGGNAEVRYLAPLLPLCIAIAVVAVAGMSPWSPRVKTIAIGIAVLSMVLQPIPNGSRPVFGSSALGYYRELIHPQREPYTPMIEWINAHVAPNESIYIQPDWMMYPLMFRAGHAMYAWQLTDPPKSEEYRNLPEIHFAGRVPPDYLIACGPWRKEIGQIRDSLAARGTHYELADTIHVFWKDEYRPERLWRSFVTIEPKEGEEIYVYRRVK